MACTMNSSETMDTGESVSRSALTGTPPTTTSTVIVGPRMVGSRRSSEILVRALWLILGSVLPQHLNHQEWYMSPHRPNSSLPLIRQSLCTSQWTLCWRSSSFISTKLRVVPSASAIWTAGIILFLYTAVFFRSV